MSQTLYTKDHEYLRLEDDIVVVGITDYAQQQLGDVVFVELPMVGAKFDKGQQAAVVESVKAASEVYAPVSGEVVALNYTLEGGNPALVNEDPAGAGWFFKLRPNDRAEFESLMGETEYDAYLESLG